MTELLKITTADIQDWNVDNEKECLTITYLDRVCEEKEIYIGFNFLDEHFEDVIKDYKSGDGEMEETISVDYDNLINQQLNTGREVVYLIHSLANTEISNYLINK